MIKSDKKLKELEAILNKENSNMITATIISLRDEQPFEGAVSLLAAHYDRSKDKDVRRTIEHFMNDLKDPSVCPEVAGEIGKKWNDHTISMLVSSCWQSGLDYSAYSADIAKAYMKGDYVTAIECLTALEAIVNDISHDQRKEIINMLQSGTLKAAAEKRELTLELISVLNG